MSRLYAVGILGALASSALAADPVEYFETSVRPLLAEKCFACHTQSKMGGLEMVSRQALLGGGKSGPAVVPRHPERSLLIRAVRYQDEKLRMPPTERLSDEQVALLTRWVDEGAVWPEEAAAQPTATFEITDEHRRFWAFQGVREPAPPEGAGSPIDRFIDEKLAAEGLKAAPPADKRTLIRRAYLDLIGIPPTPEQAEVFFADESPHAFAKVVDDLLASPRYGERWGRHWLDVARYSDDRLNSTKDEPYPNAYRYRDWVIEAFNRDMPYDLFVKAQLAGDQIPEDRLGGYSREDLVGGLGFYGLSPKFQDDRIDATGRGFLGLTIGCAQCHDHKFDPIPTEDYYALLGVFNSTKIAEHPLAPAEVVERYEARKERADEAEARLNEFLSNEANQLVEALAHRTADYLMAVYSGAGADASGLDAETLGRWKTYLEAEPKEHPLLERWSELAADDEARRFADEFQGLLLSVIAEKRSIEHENEIRLGVEPDNRARNRVQMLSLPRDEYFLWRDVASNKSRDLPAKADTGVLYYKGESIDRLLSPTVAEHVERARAQVEALRGEVPEKYPFLHVIADVEDPANEHVHIRGNADNLGDEVQRRFLRVLSGAATEPFTEGSGRLELADAIACSDNPLTARVMVNRIWLHHFGRGLVGTPSNFGQMGERPSHPQLLDYLASRFVDSGWSVKQMHREIMLSDAYRRGAAHIGENAEVDPDARLLWRFQRRRMDVEALRDSTLAVAGALDLEAGGPPADLSDIENRRRSVYGFVSRRRLELTLGLFDFPNPNNTSPRRIATDTPLQGLYFLNSEFLMQAAEALAARLEREADDETARIERAYRLLYLRSPSAEELRLSRGFLRENNWPELAQALLTTNEFLYVE